MAGFLRYSISENVKHFIIGTINQGVKITGKVLRFMVSENRDTQIIKVKTSLMEEAIERDPRRHGSECHQIFVLGHVHSRSNRNDFFFFKF